MCIKELMQFKEFCPKSNGKRIITSKSISCSFILTEFFPHVHYQIGTQRYMCISRYH